MKNRIAAACLAAALVGAAGPASGQQTLTYRDAPYDLCKANWQAANYLQALLNPRWNAEAFAQDRFGAADGRGGLYFLDDQGRVIRCFVEEAERSPVARVEAVAALAKGLLAARIPGTSGRYFFTIDGRQAIFLQPRGGQLAAHWVQDTATPFATLRVEVRGPKGWELVSLQAPEHPTEVMDAETVLTSDSKGYRVEVHNLCAVYDRPPYVLITSDQPVDVRVALAGFGGRHTLWLDGQEHDARGGVLQPQMPRQGFLLAHRDGPRAAAARERRGWEAPALWNTLDDMVLLAWEPADAQARAHAANGLWQDVRLEWRQQRRLRLSIAPFLELDPADCQYVFAAGERVARDGVFGFKPYFPARSSNGFMGALTGLAPAAWLLTEHHHPLAPQVKQAALEAFAAILRSEESGRHGEYGYNAISAAGYLRRLAPDRFDYNKWVRVWADRELARCPAGWVAPPWDDTALRAIRGWREAFRIAGDDRYRQAAENALAQFDLPPKGPVDAFLWKGQRAPFNGYDCTATAMLLGEWGNLADPRASRLVEDAAPRVLCDFGLAPYETWTCDDLLPYYVGYCLPAVFGDTLLSAPKRLVRLDEYVGYDRTGRVWSVPRPDFAGREAR